MNKTKSVINVLISFAILIVLWQLIYTVGGFSKALFPSPYDALIALKELFTEESVLTDIGASMARFATGYISSIICAVLLGLVLGRLPKVFQYINPVIQLLRPISPMAWLPFIVLWFGIGDIPAVVIIFIAAFFPVLLSTVSAVGKIDPIYMKVSKSFGIKQPQLMWKIIFPASFPQIANSIHLALGTAWVFLVAGEMVGSQSGLGYLIIDSRNNLRADTLMAVIIIIGIIGLLLDTILGLLEKQILKTWGEN
ncbi:MAG: ABC transporter permease [Ruminococcus sp.]|nr:ABC transporter permease [Ruminococcus sp.]